MTRATVRICAIACLAPWLVSAAAAERKPAKPVAFVETDRPDGGTDQLALTIQAATVALVLAVADERTAAPLRRAVDPPDLTIWNEAGA